MANVQVRDMKLADLPQVAPLSAQLGYPDSVEVLTRRFHALAQEKIMQSLLVAEADKKIVGWIHVLQNRTLESEPSAVITALVVDQNVRRSGAGRALVNAAVDWTRKHGIQRLRVRSNIKRDEAHKFYPGVGFALNKTQHVYEMRLSK